MFVIIIAATRGEGMGMSHPIVTGLKTFLLIPPPFYTCLKVSPGFVLFWKIPQIVVKRHSLVPATPPWYESVRHYSICLISFFQEYKDTEFLKKDEGRSGKQPGWGYDDIWVWPRVANNNTDT